MIALTWLLLFVQSYVHSFTWTSFSVESSVWTNIAWGLKNIRWAHCLDALYFCFSFSSTLLRIAFGIFAWIYEIVFNIRKNNGISNEPSNDFSFNEHTYNRYMLLLYWNAQWNKSEELNWVRKAKKKTLSLFIFYTLLRITI